MSWNYRIIKMRQFEPTGEENAPLYYIGEVYYADDEKSIHSWSTPDYNPLVDEDVKGLEETLAMLQKAIDLPIYEIPPTELSDGGYTPPSIGAHHKDFKKL